MMRVSAVVLVLLVSGLHASLSLYKDSLKKNIQLLEKKQSIADVIRAITPLPILIQLDLVYHILLASKVFTITQREELLRWALPYFKATISQTDYANLVFIKDTFLEPLKVLHKGPRLSYLVAGPNAQLCNKKSTLLMKAVNEGRISLITKLLELGANPNAQDTQGLTALYFAPTIEIAQLLLNAKANINHLDNNGSNILFYEDNPDMIKFFVSKKADVEHLNKNDQNAIIYHAEHNEIDAIKALLEAGARINQRNSDGLTALDLAFEHPEVTEETIDFLISQGAKTSDDLG
ncbi:hypothetical protein Noda2021_01330 [Candidatus Dependentiae bacterium Noda2021]|nr:hypothetical protein Noda2021_01330 [Candidatus Dependentiae bacterium Noda2021]